MDLTVLLEYLIRILPGIVLFIAVIIFVPKSMKLLRIIIYIFFFILMRDAMTPTGLWKFGKEGFFWIRFVDDSLILIIFALGSLAFILSIIFLIDKELHRYISWIKGRWLISIPMGIAGAFLAYLPLVFFHMNTPIESRGGIVAPSLYLPIFLIAFFANFMEETLFRGFFQGYLDRDEGLPAWRSILLSGIMFPFCHIFLALTVTDIGMNLLIFALYEGIICAILNHKYGLIAATLTHGGAIFLLSTGIIV
jgi:hypothetical protein